MLEKQINDFIDGTINDNKLQKINNIYLSKKQIDILNRYDIDYKNVVDIRELIFKVEDILNDSFEELYDLEELSRQLSEFNYYHNTRK